MQLLSLRWEKLMPTDFAHGAVWTADPPELESRRRSEKDFSTVRFSTPIVPAHVNSVGDNKISPLKFI